MFNLGEEEEGRVVGPGQSVNTAVLAGQGTSISLIR